jgi:sodium-dependent dicarboxylate transporter 2/3/5
LKYLTGPNTISFGEWMVFGLPYALILLLIGWGLLQWLFPPKTDSIILEIKGTFLKNWKAYIVYVTFALTILLWLTDFLHGMNAYVVAMIPVGVFSAFGIINKNDLRNISWDVLWLVSGGIALGYAMEQSGLAARIIEIIPFDNQPAILIIVLLTLLAAVMANFMSNTATANLLLPLVAALGYSISSLQDFGGAVMIILATTISCSMGMALPISTPPNALAYGTGTIKSSDLAKIGGITAVIGLLLTYLLMFFLNFAEFFDK